MNVGARCLAPGSGFLELVEELTNTWTIPPGRLTLELTESALIDNAVPGLLTRLEDMGEQLSIDALWHRLLIPRISPAASGG